MLLYLGPAQKLPVVVSVSLLLTSHVLGQYPDVICMHQTDSQYSQTGNIRHVCKGRPATVSAYRPLQQKSLQQEGLQHLAL